MNKTLQALLTSALAAIIAVGAVYAIHPTTEQPGAKESVFDRVMRTGILRCGYLIYRPEVIKDPNTGELSGYVFDIVNEIGRQLNVKVEWTTEIGFGFQNIPEDFKLGRYDAVCSGFVESAAHARAALFSIPVDYAPEYAYVRTDDTRFDQSLDGINNPDIKIAQIDGEVTQAIAKEIFPLAGSYSLPETSDVSLALEAVATGKADVAISAVATANGYLEHNAGKLKIIRNHMVKAWIQPVMAFPHGEHDFKYVVDATIRGLEQNGFIEKTFRKYDPNLNSYLMIARPYQAP